MVAILIRRTPPMKEGTTPKTRHRSPGEGSVYEVREGFWRGALTWTDPDGSRHRRFVSGHTSAAARDALDDLRRDLKLGTLVPAGRGATVGDYLADWIEREKTHVRPSTWRSREMHVRCYLVPALGKRALSRLTPSEVERALGRFVESGRPVTASDRKRGRQKHAPVSPLTARHVRATLRIALAAAVREGRLGRNVAADARPPYVAHRSVEYLSAAEVRQLLEATAASDYANVYALAVSTGLRLGELLGLSWPDIDLAERAIQDDETHAGSLTVRRSLAVALDGGWSLAEPKSARSRRTIPLPGLARAALKREQERQSAARAAAGKTWQDREQLVFTDALGRPLRPEGVSAAFQRAREAAGVPHVPFHGLRHSAATLMLAEGVPLAVISEWLGHAGIAITAAHYAAVVPALRREAADAMDRALR
jgi:integrase